MEPVTEARLRELFASAQIDVASNPALVGNELTYRVSPPRVIVIHLGETDSPEYCVELMSRVLQADEAWILVTRYGSIADLGLMPGLDDAKALAFGALERRELATYLCTRSTALSSVSADLYVIGGSGNTLITWDHHSADEGIEVALQSVSAAGRLLVSLNELGTELELFSTT
jgi:hypothetical protein